MKDMLEPFDEPTTLHKASTEHSRFAESLIVTFLKSGASKSRVRIEKTPYDIDKLYELCRRVCRKKAFFKLVSVSKNDGNLLLIRRSLKNNER